MDGSQRVTVMKPRIRRSSPSDEPAWPMRQALALLAICLLVVPFWAAYEQTSNTLPLFFQDCTHRSLLGTEVPAAWLQARRAEQCTA